MKAVVDIGKTNIKLQLVDDLNVLLESFSRKNTVIVAAPYPHVDVAGIWQWLIDTLANYSRTSEIHTIVITTHGATAALIDESLHAQDLNGQSLNSQDLNSQDLNSQDLNIDSLSCDGLVLPVLDYEYTGINSCDQAYNNKRPDYAESLSPNLPAGLNLGRQIFWLQENFPVEFSRATCLLMYPQYWGWRLTGVLACEVTSLGCHTDLWSPSRHCYSELVEACHWHNLMPPLQPAWKILGKISSRVSRQTGLPSACVVHVGLHDSNASYLRYLLENKSPEKEQYIKQLEENKKEKFTVISTGTWTILMSAGASLSVLKANRDMLANCDIYGNPVVCARFMGGREYDLICQRLGGGVNSVFDEWDIQSAIDNLWMVTPDFSAGNGPFSGLSPGVHCLVPALSASAIATLYCALMIDQRLTDLQSKGAIYIEGAFLKNPLLCQLVAQLRREQPVYLSADDTGTVQGALLLTAIEQGASTSLQLEYCSPGKFSGLETYKSCWYTLINERQTKRTFDGY